MTEQHVQLEVMAEGGFDISVGATADIMLDERTPESMLILKERVEARLRNPCTGCQYEHTSDPYILDFCHQECKEPDVEIIDLD